MAVFSMPHLDVPAPRLQAEDVGPARVTVGADDSHWGRAALRWAADHAWMSGAELDVLAPRATDDLPGLGHPELTVRIWPTADPVNALVDASRFVRMIVLGRHDHRHRGIGLGVIVQPVVEGACCDVVVVGGGVAALRGDHGRISVLLGCGRDDHAVISASGLAARRGSTLEIVQVIRPSSTSSRLLPTEWGQVALDEAAAVARAAQPGVPVVATLATGYPHDVVARLRESDVIVVGGDPGPMAWAALYHGPAPVLVAREAR